MHQPKCDRCGKFFSPSKGGSWLFVPSSDVSMGDERERCVKCTKEHGALSTHGQYVDAVCCGTYTTHNAIELTGRGSEAPEGPR